MATILDQSAVCDGFDVRCRLSNGETVVFHFTTTLPSDVQAAVDALEAAHLASLAVQETVLEIVEE